MSADLNSRLHLAREWLGGLLNPGSLFRSLSRKLILLMSLGIVCTSTFLGWYLANSLIDHSRETLIETGTILANNLASNGRYSLYTKDQLRLGRLIESALKAEDVVYVQFVGSNGQIIRRATKGQLNFSSPHTRTPGKSLFPPSATTQTGLSSSLPIVITPFHAHPDMKGTMLERMEILVPSWIPGSPFPEMLLDFAVPVFRGVPSEPLPASLSSLEFSLAEEQTRAPTHTSSQPISGLVQLGLSDTTLVHDLQAIVAQVILITLLVIVLGVAVTTFLARRITIPLKTLTAMSHRITEGDFNVNPLPPQDDEIGDLNAAFIHMLTALKERDALVHIQISRLQALHDIETEISTSTNERALISNVMDYLHEQAGFKRLFLGLFSTNRQTLYGVELRGNLMEEEFSFYGKEYVFAADKGKLGQVLDHGNSLLIRQKDELTHPSDHLLFQVFSQMEGDFCILSPIKSERQILGILAAESCLVGQEAEDVAFIQAVSSQTGIAIDRLRTHTKLEEANITLESRVLDRTRDLQAANEQLQEADRLRAKFVAVTSHELRTPLTTIRMFTDNMLHGIVGPLEERQKYYLSRINVNARRLQRLIRDLLDLAHIESGHMKLSFKSVSLPEVIKEVVKELLPVAETHGVTIRVEPSMHLAVVWGDSDKLFQILNNLIHNAIKFTGSDCTVTLTIGFPENQQVQICIADTGCGIAPKELKNIFQPFYRIASPLSPNSGVGLGLALTHELVTLHNGTLRVESDPGHGSRFYVSLPSPAYSETEK